MESYYRVCVLVIAALTFIIICKMLHLQFLISELSFRSHIIKAQWRQNWSNQNESSRRGVCAFLFLRENQHSIVDGIKTQMRCVASEGYTWNTQI